MRYAGNFHPEWGYLAPAPNFVRTARVVLVATAIGATAGAGVVFSLVGRADTETSVAARTLAQTADTASAQLNLPQATRPAHVKRASGGQDRAPRSLAADVPRAGTSDSESKPSSTTMAPAGIAALAEAPAATGEPPTNLAAAPSLVPSPEAQPRHASPAPTSSPSPSAVAAAKATVSPPAPSAPATASMPAPAADAPSSPSADSPPSALVTAKASGSPPAVSAPSAAPAPVPAEKKMAIVNVKKRVPPRFASRGMSSRLTPGAYYMSADNYRENARGYYRDSGWGGGSYYGGGGRYQDW
jgi:hypothetical protein